MNNAEISNTKSALAVQSNYSHPRVLALASALVLTAVLGPAESTSVSDTLPVFGVLSAPSEAAAGEVTEFGMFTVPPRGHAEFGNEGFGGEDFNDWGVLVERTHAVEADLGSFMGFCYRLTGLNDRTVAALTYRVEHPPILRPDGSQSRGFSYRRPMIIHDGSVAGCSGFSFDSQAELVPGRWRLSYTYRGQELVSQEFEVRIKS